MIRRISKMAKLLSNFSIKRSCEKKLFNFSKHISTFSVRAKEKLELDYDYLLNPQNETEILLNIKGRKLPCEQFKKFLEINEKLSTFNLSHKEKNKFESDLEDEALLIPNKGSPHLKKSGEVPIVLKSINKKPQFDFKAREFHKIANRSNLIISGRLLSIFSNKRSYYLCDALADLEQALIRYTVTELVERGFKIISVPDILPCDILKKCGQEAESSEVFHLKNEDDLYLSGTAEMGIGGYLQGKTFQESDLPLKFASVSRCFRKEIGAGAKDAGIFRVNYFTKVEMFGVTANETSKESRELYDAFVDIQIKLYSQLGIHFKVLDMPLQDLARPAYSKTDIEAWIPVERLYKEISSSSNCTDFQSRRLNIKYKDSTGKEKFVHTINGTACAVPRCIIALVASHQRIDELLIPEVLRPYMDGDRVLAIPKPENVSHPFIGAAYPGVVEET